MCSSLVALHHRFLVFIQDQGAWFAVVWFVYFAPLVGVEGSQGSEGKLADSWVPLSCGR